MSRPLHLWVGAWPALDPASTELGPAGGLALGGRGEGGAPQLGRALQPLLQAAAQPARFGFAAGAAAKRWPATDIQQAKPSRQQTSTQQAAALALGCSTSAAAALPCTLRLNSSSPATTSAAAKAPARPAEIHTTSGLLPSAPAADSPPVLPAALPAMVTLKVLMKRLVLLLLAVELLMFASSEPACSCTGRAPVCSAQWRSSSSTGGVSCPECWWRLQH
jgi:hypothetical protein